MGIRLTNLSSPPRLPITGLHDVFGQGIATFEAPETWSDGGLVTTGNFIGQGLGSLKLLCGNGATVSATCAAPAGGLDAVNYPVMELLVYISDVTKLAALTGYLATDGTFNKSFNFVMPDTMWTQLRTGWNTVRLKASSLWVTNGMAPTDWANVTALLVRAQAVAGQSVDVYFASWRMVKPRPVIMLDHDDGHSSMIAMYAIEEALGLRSTSYLVTHDVGTAGSMTWADAQRAHRAGHDVCSHGHMHLNYAEKTGAEIETDVRTAKTILAQRGFRRGLRFIGTPFGAGSRFDAAAGAVIWPVLAKYHEVARVAVQADGENYVYPLGYNIPTAQGQQHAQTSVSVVNAPNVATVYGWIDAAIAAGSLIHLNFHRLGNETNVTTVPVAYYQAVCQYIAAKVKSDQCDCMTMSEFHDQGATMLDSAPMAFRQGIAADGTATLSRLG